MFGMGGSDGDNGSYGFGGIIQRHTWRGGVFPIALFSLPLWNLSGISRISLYPIILSQFLSICYYTLSLYILLI